MLDVGYFSDTLCIEAYKTYIIVSMYSIKKYHMACKFRNHRAGSVMAFF